MFNQRDQAGAEALIVAKLAPKGQFDELFKWGIKPHVFVALNNFLSVWSIKCADLDIDKFTRTPIKDLPSTAGWDILSRMIADSDEWAAHERYYFIAKQMCHSGNYGIGVNEFILNTLSKSRGTVALSKEQGAEYLCNYRSMFPEIIEWHDMVRRQIKETRMLFNLFGHPWIYTAEIEEDRMKDCLAFVPQSTVGVITHIAVTKMQSFIEKHRRDWHILNNNHDSYLTASPEKEWEECQHKMKEFINMDLLHHRENTFK